MDCAFMLIVNIGIRNLEQKDRGCCFGFTTMTEAATDVQFTLPLLRCDLGVSAFPEEDNIFCGKGTITGSKVTVFEGTEYKLSLLDILQDKWSSAYDVKTIQLSIQNNMGAMSIDVLWILPVLYHDTCDFIDSF